MQHATSAPTDGDVVGMSFVPFGRVVLVRTTNGGRLGFQFRLDFVVRKTDDTTRLLPIAYPYRLLEPGGREILAYHWHPEGVSHLTYPHLHLSSRDRPIPLEPVGQTISLADHHIPTSHVTLVDIVRYLIVEVGVEPRREDWCDVIGSGVT